MLSLESGGYLRYRYSMDTSPDVPYFGFLRSLSKNITQSEKSETRRQKGKGNRVQKVRLKGGTGGVSKSGNITYMTIDAVAAFDSGPGDDQTFKFFRYLSTQKWLDFNFLNKKQSKVSIDAWKGSKTQNPGSYTTTFFDKSIICQGKEIVNFTHTLQNKYQITLQPFKPVYHTLFESLPLRAANHSKSKKSPKQPKMTQKSAFFGDPPVNTYNGYQLTVLNGSVSGISMPYPGFYVEVKIPKQRDLKVGNQTSQNPVFFVLNSIENGALRTVFVNNLEPSGGLNYSFYLIRDMDLSHLKNGAGEGEWEIKWINTSFYPRRGAFGTFFPNSGRFSRAYELDSQKFESKKQHICSEVLTNTCKSNKSRRINNSYYSL